MDEKQRNDANRILQAICDLPPTLFTPPEDAWKYQTVLTRIAARSTEWIDLDEFVETSGINKLMLTHVVAWLDRNGFLETHDHHGVRIHPQLLAYIEHGGAPAQEAQAYGLGVERMEEEFRGMRPERPLRIQLLDALDRITDADADFAERTVLNELTEIADDFPDNLSLFEICERLEEPQRTHFIKLGAELTRRQIEKQYRGYNA